MPITERQRTRRSSHVTSTDVAKVLNISPWGSAYDVWLEKTGRLQSDKHNEAIEAGIIFEEGVLKYSESKLGKLQRNCRRVRADLNLAANIDAIVVAEQEPVEAKTASLFSLRSHEWGEANTDQIPEYYLIQCVVHMMCMRPLHEPDVCHLTAFIGGKGFRIYRIDYDDTLADIIATRVQEFWENHVQADSAPTDSMPLLENIRRIVRKPKKTISLPSLEVDQLRSVRDQLRQLEKKKKELERDLLTQMGDAEVGKGESSQIEVTWQTRSVVDTKRVKEEYPELVKETTYPVVRVRNVRESQAP